MRPPSFITNLGAVQVDIGDFLASLLQMEFSGEFVTKGFVADEASLVRFHYGPVVKRHG